MSRAVLIVGLALSLASCGSDPADASGDAASDPAVPELAILAEHGGPDGGYDYLSVDSDARRVFAAREFGVMAVDFDTGKVTDRLIEANDVSAVLPIAGTNEMLSTIYGDNEAVLFDRSTGEEIARIAVGEKPDAAAYDPDSGLAFVMNAGGNSISLIDVADRAPVGTIAVGGKPEAGAIDGKGHLFVNIEDTAEIAVIDIAARTVARRLPLPGCVEPTGIAYDALSDTLISACHNGVAKLIDAGSGADKVTVQVGRNADGAIFDPRSRLAYRQGRHPDALPARRNRRGGRTGERPDPLWCAHCGARSGDRPRVPLDGGLHRRRRGRRRRHPLHLPHSGARHQMKHALPLLLAGSLIAGTPAAAETIQVCPEGSQTQSCDFTGNDAVQQAVDRAADGDVIRLAPGRYVPSSYRDVPSHTLPAWAR